MSKETYDQLISTLDVIGWYWLGLGTFGPKWWLAFSAGAAVVRFILMYRASKA